MSHTTSAKRVNEKNFFQVGTSGGTIVSSCLELELEAAEKEFHPNSWNIYTFYCGDGENWASDNEKCIDLFKEIKKISQLTAYCEINEDYKGLTDPEPDKTTQGYPWDSFSAWKNEDKNNLWSKLTPICDNMFKKIMIGGQDDIWVAFNTLFGGKTADE